MSGIRPVCQSRIPRPAPMPDKECGRVMVEVGTTVRKGVSVYACPRCDAALAMPTQNGGRR